MVKLLDVFPQGLGFVLVFEYMLSDLGEIIANDANASVASMGCCATRSPGLSDGTYIWLILGDRSDKNINEILLQLNNLF